MDRRGFLLGIATAMIPCAVRGQAVQAPPPTFRRPVTLIVPFAAGNTADIVARLLSEPLADRIGQSVIVDNRPGGGGIVGVGAAARAEADGHALLITTPSPLVLNPVIYRTLPYDTLRDFVPLGLISSQPMILLASRGLGVSTMAEFVAKVRTSRPELTYASVGNGTYSHFAVELLLGRIGARAVHVPYRGAAPALTDLIADRVSFMLDGFATGYEQAKGGALVGLAVTSPERVARAQEVATFAESGVGELRDFEVSGWVGLLAPRATPPAIVEFYERALMEILATGPVRERLLSLAMAPAPPAGPSALLKAIEADTARWRHVAATSGIELRN